MLPFYGRISENVYYEAKNKDEMLDMFKDYLCKSDEISRYYGTKYL